MSRVLDIARRPFRRLAEHRRSQQPLTMAKLRAYAANIDNELKRSSIEMTIGLIELAADDQNMTRNEVLKSLGLRRGDLPKLSDNTTFLEQKVDKLLRRRAPVPKGKSRPLTAL